MGSVGATPSSLLLLFAVCCCCCCRSSDAHIPARYDGFVYKIGAPLREDSIVVEAFLDPLCPHSREAWPPLKRVLSSYSPRVFFDRPPFPPSVSPTSSLLQWCRSYHDNSYLSCRALHIAKNLNSSSTYPLLELFFMYQEMYYNWPTQNMSKQSIIEHIRDLAVAAVGNSSASAFEEGFKDPKTDRAARDSFNYGCSRGVTGTPFFFVNGFHLPGSALGFDQWSSVLDPLLSATATGEVGDGADRPSK